MRSFLFFIPLILIVSCSDEPSDCCNDPDPDPKELIQAADVSFLPEIEAAGTKFYDAAGTEKNVLDILKENGVNTIRVRLWHTPEGVHSSLSEVKTFTQRIKSKGFKVWLTVHYSDTWADPDSQVKPAAWADATFTDLADSVYRYTKKIMTALNPDIIQIGNEINPGLLLPEGDYDNTANFTTLLKKGAQAVREHSATTKIMIHYAGINLVGTYGAQAFFQKLKDNNVDYDMIGLSYYPVWHGKDLLAVQTSLNTLGNMFQKEILIAETSYPFTLLWNDNKHNTVGTSDQLVNGYPATPLGQKNFLLKIKDIVTKSPKGIGFAWWAPEWVAFKGADSEDGSSAENLTFFDFDNKALPVLDAYHDPEE